MNLKSTNVTLGLTLYLVLAGCAKQAIVDPEESILILSSIQAAEDPISVEAANELSVLLEDLHLSLFSPEGRAPAGSPEALFPELFSKMSTWREHAHLSRPIVLNLEAGLFTSSWDSEDLEKLAEQYPLEQGLWSFFEVAASFMWDSAPSYTDTYLCLWIWRHSPLQDNSANYSGWEPRIEPALHRLVAELRYTVGYASGLSVQELENVYGNTPEEFKMSVMNDTQACSLFLDRLKHGASPTASEVEQVLKGTFLKRQAQLTVEGIKLFQDRSVQ